MTPIRYSRWLIIGLALLLLSIVVVAWANQVGSEKPAEPQWMAADFAVGNMSCGGCVYTIQQSLKPLEGIQTIDVDIRGQKVSTIYDANKLTDPQLIAKAITDSGYPAKFTSQTPLKAASAPYADAKENIPPIAGSCGTGGGCSCSGGYNYKVQ